MICLVCRQAHPAPGFCSIVFERNEMKVVVKSVPSLICHSCGEAYVDSLIAAQLLKIAEETAEVAMLEGNRGYRECEFTLR